jgi:hypothetical protein
METKHDIWARAAVRRLLARLQLLITRGVRL